MRCSPPKMSDVGLVLLVLVSAAAAVAAQQNDTDVPEVTEVPRSTSAGFAPINLGSPTGSPYHSGGHSKPKPISFTKTCSEFPVLSGNDSQTYQKECWSTDFPVDSTAEGVFNWTSGMTPNTAIRSVQLQLVGDPLGTAEGTDYITLSGSFLSGPWILPTCTSQERFALSFNEVINTTLTYPTSWSAYSARRHGRPIKFTCPGSRYTALSPAGDADTDEASAATFKWTPKPRVPTPDGLRVRLACQRGSAGGACSATVRLLVVFTGNELYKVSNVFEKLSDKMEAKDNYKCDVRSWRDAEGVLGCGKNKTIDTEVCFPPKSSQANNGKRKLLQAGPVAQTINMATAYPYEAPIIVKATRLARYASAVHGCLPSVAACGLLQGCVPSLDAVPQTYTAADGSTQLREWDGPTGMSRWGGPGTNGQPGPECRSCFKDGISWTDPPRGFQTPRTSTPFNTNSFLDAAIVFTDSVISGVAGQRAVVVLFRATATAIAGSQWLSNLGSCFVFAAENLVSPTPNNPASGSVCSGWRTPVDDLITLGLQTEVLRRLNALPQAERTVYVVGHSRGGAFASVFAAKLLALQAAGGLPTYSGDRLDQIKLYTFGAPRAGDTFFAAYLENNMKERYRVVNRYDAVPSKPSLADGYSHFRPSIWYRDSTSNILPSPAKGCLLLNQNQLTSPQQSCFISCNSVLTCSFGAGTNIPAPTDVTSSECTSLSDRDVQALSASTAPGSALPVPGQVLIDHASYMGIDMNNDGCRANLAFIGSITPTPCGPFGVATCCEAVTT